MTPTGPATVTVAAKLPQELATALRALAQSRSVTQSSLIREIVAATLEGEIHLPSLDEIARREAAAARERLLDNVRQSLEFKRSHPVPKVGFNVQAMYEANLARRGRATRRRCD